MVGHSFVTCVNIGICLQLFVFVAGDHPVPTYFRRTYDNGTLVDRSSPHFDEHIRGHDVIETIPNDGTVEPIKLEALPDPVENGGKVTVLWSGITNPQPKDWIGFYCPFIDTLEDKLDFFFIHDVKGHEKDHGHKSWTVFNMRDPCVFKFYRQVFTNREKNSYHYVLGAVSNQLKFANGGPFAPLQGHISLTNDPTEMRIMWVSAEVHQPPVVRYGPTTELKLTEYSHLVRTYTRDDLCNAPANGNMFKDPGITYDVVVKNLKPNTLYYYAYGTEDYMSDVANFTTAIPAGDTTPFNFIVYGDMGVYTYFPRSTSTALLSLKEVRERNARYVFHVGDISYARGYAYLWDQWGWLIEPYATLAPYMVGIGNHEYDHIKGGIGRDPSGVKTDHGWKPEWFNGDYDSYGECGVPTFKRYHMPDNGNSLFWYSYDYGLVHMIMMSTEHDSSPNSTQYKWLENDLKNVDRIKTPWVVLGGHRPMYNSQKYPKQYRVSIHFQELFEDLLYKYKVDISLWGHYHSYERTCKVYKGKCVHDGVVHVTVGNAGYSLMRKGWHKKKWSLVRILDYGYGRVAVANSSALLFELVLNTHGKVQDHVWLYK